MRRSHLGFLTAVSLAALVSASTSTQAVTPPTMNLGLLKPQDHWKVGTVNADGASYCAMVGKFDKQVVLAFARSPEGYGSIAMDFRERFFEPAAEYEVDLKVDGSKTRTLVGRASSDRSVVVQVGQDDRFFEALKSNSSLDIGMPTIDVSFSLRQFAASYKNLVKCSGQLSSDTPKVEKSDLSPIDHEVKKLSGETDNQQIASAATAMKKSGGFDDMEGQLEAEAKAEQEKAQENIGKIDETAQNLTQKLTDEKKEVAALEEKKEKVERKLIASLGKESAGAVTATGLTAQEIEKQQVAVTQYLRAEEEAKKSAWMKEQVAALEVRKTKEAEEHVAAFNKKEADLAQRELELQRESDRIAAEKFAAKSAAKAAEDDKALKAAIVAKQAQIAAIETERVKQSEQLTQKLAAMQTDHLARIVSLEAERDSLKKQLNDETAKNLNKSAELDKALADKLAGAEKAKRELEDRISTLDRQNKLLEASLSGAQFDLAQAEKEVGKNKEAAGLQMRLQAQLDEKTAQYDALKRQLDTQQVKSSQADTELNVEYGKIVAQLSEKQLVISQLETKLKDTEARRAAEAERVLKTQADLDAALKQIAELRKGLNEQDRSAQAEIEKRAAEIDVKEKQLISDRAAFEAERRQTAAVSVSDENEKLKAVENEIERLKSANAALSQRLAAQVLNVAEPSSGTADAEIEKRAVEIDLKEKQLISERAAFEAERAQMTAVSVSDGDERLKAAENEIEHLKSANAALSQRLAVQVLSGTEPASGTPDVVSEKEPESKGRGLFGLRGYRAGDKAAVNTAGNFPVPAVPSAPVVVEQVAEVQKIAPAAANRAAAFLDRVMAFHRPQDASAFDNTDASFDLKEEPVAEAVVETVAATEKDTSARPSSLAEVVPVRGVLDEPKGIAERPSFADVEKAPIIERSVVSKHVAVDVPAAAPVAVEPQVASAIENKKVDMRQSEDLSNIETAAGTSVIRSVQQPSFVPSTPVAAAAPVSSETIEKILEKSGIRNVTYIPVDATQGENVRQWTTGSVSGMYEQMPSSGKGFDAEVEDYLSRYREDCPAHLKVSVGPAEASAAGTSAVADISCSMPSNTYTSSFVFLENAAGFSAVLHAGLPQDAAKVKSFSDNIAYTLGTTGDAVVPPAVVRQAAVQAPAPAPMDAHAEQKLKFRIDIAAPASDVPVAGDFETVVVQ